MSILAMLAMALGGSPAAAQRGLVLDNSFIVGAWTDNGDCSAPATFGDDGRFATPNGRGGIWVVDGDRMILTGDQTITLRISIVDRNTIRVVNPDGSPGGSTRCGRDGPAPRRAPPRLNAAFVEGRWTDNGDCSDAAAFDRAGGFAASDGGQGRWTLAGDRLTMSGRSTLVLRIVAIDPNIMIVINPDGQLGRSTRC